MSMEEKKVFSIEEYKGMMQSIKEANLKLYEHSCRVAELSKALSVELGYTEEKATMIKMSAALYSIGKLDIASDILNKSETITNEDYAALNKVKAYGAERLKGYEKLPNEFKSATYGNDQTNDIRKIILVAKKYDLLSAKIIEKGMVKPQVPQDVVIDILKRSKELDPKTVSAFIKIIPNINIDYSRADQEPLPLLDPSKKTILQPELKETSSLIADGLSLKINEQTDQKEVIDLLASLRNYLSFAHELGEGLPLDDGLIYTNKAGININLGLSDEKAFYVSIYRDRDTLESVVDVGICIKGQSKGLEMEISYEDALKINNNIYKLAERTENYYAAIHRTGKGIDDEIDELAFSKVKVSNKEGKELPIFQKPKFYQYKMQGDKIRQKVYEEKANTKKSRQEER